MKEKKTLIGITGNIATGKSVVRRMLANAGALGLDADVISHRMIYPSGPAHQDVVDAFGERILTENNEISRTKLGEIVFKDPEQLAKLEAIIHPLVTDAIQQRMDKAQTHLIALEAIKLLEAGLGKICDAVWVSHAPRQIQLERLLQTRNLTEDEALNRIKAQPPQEEKHEKAQVVICTNGPFQETWKQVLDALNDTIHTRDLKTAPLLSLSGAYTGQSRHALPFEKLLDFWDAHSGERTSGLYESLGLRMIQPLTSTERIRALILWKEWNFTATLTRVIPGDALLSDFAIVMDAFIAAAQRQGCELLLLPNILAQQINLKPGGFGFEPKKPPDLPYPAWRYAAQTLSSGERVWAQILAQPLEAKGDFQLK